MADFESGGGTSTLNGLSDVTITSVADAHLLQYNSATSQWVNRTLAAIADNGYVNVTGDTMTGLLTLSGAPTADLHAATKAYVDSQEVGITSINGLTALSQTFTNDTNVTLSSSGSIHTLGWNGSLAILRGGTGATTAAGARTNLGLVIGTNVQAWDAQLDDIAALSVADGNFIVGDGTNWVAESGATARTSLGLVASGAGDIWVEKAGDTMTGNLTISGADIYLNQLKYIFFDGTAGAGGDTPGKLGIRGFNAGTNNYLSFESNLGVAMQVGRIGGNQRIIFPSTAGGVVLADNQQLFFGTSEDTAIRYSTSQTPDCWQFGVSADSRVLIIVEKADVGAFDFGHALQTNPTVFIHSATQSTTEWISLTHNVTDGVIDCGTGTLNLGGTANVNFAGATRTASTVTHDAYVTLEVAGVAYKFMLGS